MRVLLLGAGSRRDRIVVAAGTPSGTFPELGADVETVDINADHRPSKVWDLNLFPLPWEDDRFDEVHAYEVLEHLGRQGDAEAWFGLWSELWRILKPGGVVCGTSPAFDSLWAWSDPSHTRIVSSGALVFLSQEQYRQQVGRTAMSDFRFLYRADFAPAFGRGNGRNLFGLDYGGTCFFAVRAIKPSTWAPPAGAR